MKRLLSVVLTLSLLLGTLLCITTTASAASGTHGNLSWSYSNGTLTISGYGDMQEVGVLEYPWRDFMYDTLVIKEGVTSISGRAFFMGPGKKADVSIPLSVTYIGSQAFYGWGNYPDIYYGGSKEDYKALVTDAGSNTALYIGTWHYSTHSHQWTLKSTTSATCTADGVKTYSCHCGNTKTETLTKLGHNYSGTPSYAWTQVSGGYQVKGIKYCSRNSSHTITETVTATYQEITTPTCTAGGQGRYTATFTNTYFSTQTKTVTLSSSGHSYTSVVTKPTCTEKGFTTHTCSKCGNQYVDSYVSTLEHPWDSGKVTTEPTCKEAGERTFTCTVCPVTKKESIPKTNQHAYGTWTKVNESEHKHICSVCSKEEKEGHKWDGGKVTTQPTCKAVGVKTYTCSECQATRTESVEKLPHKYGSVWTKVDDDYHERPCTACGEKETAGHTWNSGSTTKWPTCKEDGVTTYTCTTCGGTKTKPIPKLTEHTYDNDCDTVCNVCQAVRTVPHKYQTDWSKDETGHWKECSACGYRKEEAKHTPGAEATETTAQLCTTCGYIIKPELGHITHKFGAEWKTDRTGHWRACSGCEEKDGYEEHKFDNACDTDCAVCGFERTTTHNFATTYKCDKTNHWYECTACGEKKDVKAHEPGPEATTETAQTCTICGCEIVPALGKAEEPTEATELPAVETEAPVDEGESGFSWWIIPVAGAAIAVIAVVVTKKKK